MGPSRKKCQFPVCNHVQMVCLTVGNYNDSHILQWEKLSKTLKYWSHNSLGEFFHCVLLIQLQFVRGFHSFPSREMPRKFVVFQAYA
jgi:hypothetical protein